MNNSTLPYAIVAACAAVFHAFAADPAPRGSDYLAVGFENYAAGTAIPGQTIADVCAWTSSDAEGAVVAAHASAPVLPNDATTPKPFVDAGDNYLGVDSSAEVACTLSNPTSSPDSTFIDAMVQFNLASSNDDVTAGVSDAKFMMWLQNDGDSTNLYAKGSRLTWRQEEGWPEGDLETSEAIFRLQLTGDESIAPGTWHRVTITHFSNIFNGWNYPIGGFTIMIDGCGVMLYNENGETPAYSQDAWDNYLRDNLATDIHDSSKNCLNLMESNTLIPSLPTSESNIRGVAFKGTGAVDDLVITSAQPTFNEFTIRWPQDATDVSYTYTLAAMESGQNDSVVTERLDEFSGCRDGMATLTRFVAGTSVTLTATLGYRTFTVSTNNVQFGGVLTLPDVQGIARYFPQTATPGQDGSAEHPFEIATALDLEILADAVANVPAARPLCYHQVADIDFAGESPFIGIGTYADNPTNGIPFTGVYDGGEHAISNVTMTARNYGGIFNQVNGGTIKDLTVVNIFAPANASGEYGYAIVGNAGNGATLDNLIAEGSFCTAAKPGTHNMAGIVIRASGGSAETLVEECRNYAKLYGNYTKIGGICAITQTKVAGGNPVRFERCWNGGRIISSRTGSGVTGHGGIVGYVDDHTVLSDCGCDLYARIVNESGANTDCDGLLVGQAYNASLTDAGDNHAPATGKMVGKYATCTVTNFQFATLVGDWDSSGGDEVYFETAWTTTPPLNAGVNYLLERNVTAADSPVFTFPNANSTISFGIALGYAIDPAALVSECGEIVSTTNGNWVTFSIRPSSSYPEYIDGEDAVIVAAYEKWAETYETDDDSEFEKQFLLNVAPETTLVGDELEITAIDLKANGTLDLTVGCSSIRGGLQGTVDGKSYRVNNGYLAVVYAATLADLATAPASTNAPLTAADNGEVTVNVNAAGAKFFKAKLSAAKEPVGAQGND